MRSHAGNLPGKDLQVLRIGFVFDPPSRRETSATRDGVAAEYEDERTISWLRDTLASFGEVLEIPWSNKSVASIAGSQIDVIFNITEAAGTRNRESLVPALAEALGIPYVGTDSVGLGLSLDKYITKIIARHEDVPTPAFTLIRDGDRSRIREKTADMRFPLIVKPNTGGSSMGIRQNSRVFTAGDLDERCNWVLDEYQEDVLVEEFVEGIEYTAGILFDGSKRFLPIAEVRLNDGDPSAFYSFEQKSIHKKEVICPASLDPHTAKEINDYAFRIFHALGCRDFARVDFRMSGDGLPFFLEINPLPGLSPYYSIFPIQAEKDGIENKHLIQFLIRNALKRKQVSTEE